MDHPATSASDHIDYARHVRQMRAVLAVYETGSTARAAEWLPLSQSAVARAVRELETTLDQALFERLARGMVPTQVGQLVAQRAQRAFAQLGQIEPGLTDYAPLVMPSPVLGPGCSRLVLGCAYRHLAAFVALCEAGNETQAAHVLGISQSAVNQTLRQLEHMVGSQLYQRSSQGARLTAEGAVVFRRVKLALDELRRVGDDLASLQGRIRGAVRIGSLPLASGSWVPMAMGRALRSHPGIDATIVDGTYDALLHQLLHADIDVIVGALRPQHPHAEVMQEPLFEDHLAVVGRKGHPLAQAGAASLKSVTQYEWITPLLGTPAHEAFERAFLAAGATVPRSRVQANSLMVLQALLMESDRLALLSPHAVRQPVMAPFLQVLPVPVSHTIRQIGLTTRVDAQAGVGVQAFITEMRTLTSSLAEPVFSH